ncbi:ATP-grasp domain-containing protein [Paenibacillus zeisoli]|uniref:ATP-grasp domain-containing protein n=1 Tax=Paenibacillus zeisoli TaxID=2496267 RepID=A0A3S1BBM7_9BACL|nr:ATP-grasp domain-containing protein [Paenibacillus zeisoli]RUT35712.1 ATP-grasp domain-containing protein [Paenibacillus zeisoli]
MKNILLVSDLGGFPPSLESLAKIANVYVYIPRPSAVTRRYMASIHRYAAGVVKESTAYTAGGYEHPEWVTFTGAEAYTLSEDEVVDQIIRYARMFKADAIMFGGAENMVLSVAKAAEALGLRSAGVEAARLARNKYIMRDKFRSAGVPSPDFRAIHSEGDMLTAVRELGYPLVLKPTYLACSIGVTLLDGSRSPVEVFREVQRDIQENTGDSLLFSEECLFLVEQYMEGCNADWYADELYADYVSVEGMMVNGVYHPVAITDKTPMLSSFTETSHIVPSVLDHDAQNIIVEACRKANESLGLQNCPTHTEVKLMKNRQVGIIETAARFGGWNIIPQINDVFGIDMTQAWAEVLLHGSSQSLPNQLLQASNKARCNMRIYLEDNPLDSSLQYLYSGYDKLDHLLSEGTRIHTETEIPKGTLVSSNPHLNAMSFVSTLDLEGTHPRALAQTVSNIRNGVRLQVTELEGQKTEVSV